MKNSRLFRALISAAAMVALPGVASAQSWYPGAEVVGQPIRVTTGNVTNTLYLDAGGSARILTPNGGTVPATWSAASGQMCLGVGGGAQECWPYTNAFQAGQPQTLTSSCASTSTWLAQATNQPTSNPRGERGQ